MQLQPFQRLYGSLYLRLAQLWPEECDSRIVNMVYLLMGIWEGRSVQTGRIAAHVPVRAKKLSIVRRLERFLSNGAVRAREWYEPGARGIIAAASLIGEIHLLLDTTKVSAYHRLLMGGWLIGGGCCHWPGHGCPAHAGTAVQPNKSSC